MIYKVNWDNGNHACGTFPYEFKTFAEADAFGKNWVSEMQEDMIYDGDETLLGYGYDVIVVERS